MLTFNTMKRHNEHQAHHYFLFFTQTFLTNNHWSPQIVNGTIRHKCPQNVASRVMFETAIHRAPLKKPPFHSGWVSWRGRLETWQALGVGLLCQMLTSVGWLSWRKKCIMWQLADEYWIMCVATLAWDCVVMWQVYMCAAHIYKRGFKYFFGVCGHKASLPHGLVLRTLISDYSILCNIH